MNRLQLLTPIMTETETVPQLVHLDDLFLSK